MYELSAEQRAAVESEENTILVVAGPGSGKSSTLVARIQHLISKGVDPQTICAISFTNAAAGLMRERLGNVKLGWCGTLHSLMFKLLQEEYPGASVMDEESTEELLTECCYKLKYVGTKKELKNAIAIGIPGPGIRPSLLELVVRDFYSTMLRNTAFSFDSILVFGQALILMSPLASVFKHILVDEFQDSGDWDAKIYRDMLAENRFFVGDPDQNLFTFRGANIQHIIDLSKSAHTLRLEMNYRCGPVICAAANKLISHNRHRIEKETTSFATDRGQVIITAHSTADEEILWLAQSIRDLQESGSKLSEIAVLLRTNDLVAKISNGLKAFSIPILEHRDAQVPEDWKKAMLLLSVIASPDNDFLMKRWLSQNMLENTLTDILGQASRQFKSINRCYGNWPHNPPAKFAVAELSRHNIGSESLESIRVALEQLSPEATASDLLIEARSRTQIVSAGQSDGVTVCTIHAAKGREFDTVFLPAFEDEIIPGTRKGQDEEERRVAFVAITRARHRLYFSHSAQREMPWKRGVQFHKPSRFLAECGVDNAL